MGHADRHFSRPIRRSASPQLVQRLLPLHVTWMLPHQFDENSPRLLRRALQTVHSRQVQVRLVEGRRHPDALLELRNGFVPPLGSQIKHAEIVQGFGISRAKLQSPPQILVGALRIVRLRKHHRQVVVRLGVLRSGSQRSLQRFPSFVPTLLQAVGVPQIFQRNPVIGTYPQRFLKVAGGLVHVSLARGQQAEIVPGVWQRIGASLLTIAAMTLLQGQVPAEMRGRVSSSSMSLISISQGIALLFAGDLASRLGVAAVFYGSAALLLLIAIAGTYRLRKPLAVAKAQAA